MKKRVLILAGIVLLVVIVFGGVSVYRGINGHGSMNYLSYLMGPYELTEEQYSWTEETLEIENGGQMVRGSIYIPDNEEEQKQVLIISHGFNCQCDLLRNKAKSLAASGIATVVYDFRGGSVKGQSDGKTEDMTVESEITDLNMVIDTIKGYDWSDDDQIYLMGESFGGLISALTAPTRDDIAGMALCFPALHSADAARAMWSSEEEIPETLKVGNMVTGHDYWKQLWNKDIFDEISGYKDRVIILHGTNDPNVGFTNSVKANEVYENSELFAVENAEHCFGGDDALSTLRTIYYFVESGK